MAEAFSQSLWAPLLIGLATGLLSGTFGVGGGIVATPLLRLCLGLSPQVAVGTTLAVILPTSLTGVINYYRKNFVDTRLALRLALPSALAGYVGARLTDAVSGSFLMVAFALLIALAGFDLLTGFSEKLKKKAAGETYESPHWSKVLPVGFLAGFLSGFFGVGGGFVMIPIFIAYFSMPLKLALGTSLLTVAFIAVPGILTHFMLNHVRLDLTLLLVSGAVPGSYLGSRLAIIIKDNLLRKAFAFIMLLIAGQMVVSEIPKLGTH